MFFYALTNCGASRKGVELVNIRKPVDYSAMLTSLDRLLVADLPQIELYCEIGRLVSGRVEKGAAIAAAEYLQTACPDAAGFSPRNLRRMREFYQAYANTPEMIDVAMKIGWTQNIIILEADLDVEARGGYLWAVRQFGWSKAELVKQINAGVHLGKSLVPCYTDKNNFVQEMAENSKSIIFQQMKHPSEPNRPNNHKGAGSGYQSERTDRICYGRQRLYEIGHLFLSQIIRIRGPSLFFEVT